MSEPETITEAELADEFRRSGRGDPERAAGRIFQSIGRNREREYEPGAVYRDPEGRLYLRTAARGWLWLDPIDTAEPRPDDWVERPLRKLVPEHARPDRTAVRAAIQAWANGSDYLDLADRICKLLEGSDEH